MEDDSQFDLKTICCICLSTDRILVQLCKINNGVNNLYFLLSYDPEAYKVGFFKNSASLHVCWECQALLRGVTCFRIRACVAQRCLSEPKIKPLECLSRLSACYSSAYDMTIASASEEDNFIDCGAVKTETDDLEDMPLSHLKSVVNSGVEKSDCCSDQENNTEENFTIPNDFEEFINTKACLKFNKKHKKLKSNEEVARKRNQMKNRINNSYKIVIKNEKVMYKSREKGKKEATIAEAASYYESYSVGFKSQIELEDHNKTKHIEDPCEAPLVKALCKPRRNGATMDEKTGLGYQCTECNKSFENKNRRWKHVQRCHKEGFPCHSCGKRFAFKHTLTRHEQLHSDPPPREECPVCHKMIRVDLTKIHARIHAPREKYSCAACDKTFVSQASYHHHLKYTMSHSNTDILKYKCEVCGKGYRSRGELRDHDNYQHRGRTRHRCPVCGKGLATRRCITRHVRRAHDGVKESARDKICQQCGKAFRDKKGLREHESIHTGDRPLSCEICGGTFRQSASLYTHKKRVHKIHAPRKQVVLEGQG